MDDETKAAAPLTPDEERALREAWAHIGSWEPWDGQEPGATYECPLCNGEGETEGTILDATAPFPATLEAYGIGPGLAAAELVAGSTGRLLTTLDEVRFERDAVQALLAATRADLDAAWQATGVATTVRGLTTLADVVTTLRESAAELRRERDAAVEGLTRELAMTRDELVAARIGTGLYVRALGRIEAALGLTGAPLGETANRGEALRLERDEAEEALAKLEAEIVEVRREKEALVKRLAMAEHAISRVRVTLGLGTEALMSDVAGKVEALAERARREWGGLP